MAVEAVVVEAAAEPGDRNCHLRPGPSGRHDDRVSETVVDREEIEQMIWALADIRVDVNEIRAYLLGEDDEEEAEEDDA